MMIDRSDDSMHKIIKDVYQEARDTDVLKGRIQAKLNTVSELHDEAFCCIQA